MHLLHSHYDFTFISRLPVRQITELLKKACERHTQEWAWQKWLTLFPHMVVPHPYSNKPVLEFKPFSEFYKGMVPVKQESAAEIIDRIEAMRKSFKHS